MKKKFIIGLLFLLSPQLCWAQQAPSLMEQALTTKLSNEIGLGLQCGAAVNGLQQEMARAQARIKALEDKYEPKPEPKKPEPKPE